MGTAGDVLGIWRGASSGQHESIVSGREGSRQIVGEALLELLAQSLLKRPMLSLVK
jgi:hypothetical protein